MTRVSGVDPARDAYRKGAVDSVLTRTRYHGAMRRSRKLWSRIAPRRRHAAGGERQWPPARRHRAEGYRQARDQGALRRLRSMGIRTVMVTGDNRITAAAIAAKAGVDDFIAEATPQNKLDYIRKVQTEGRLVAMCGDGTNDAPALAQADVGVAMQTGTQAAREAGNMVDLDSDPTKLIEIVEIGKQLLITRGSLTTFSIANDISKYFAILPAIFVATYPQLQALNIMQLRTPRKCHSLGGDLQCADHRGTGAAGLAGRKIPRHRGGRAAAAEPDDLRRWRDHRALRRDQGHRHAARRVSHLFVTEQKNVHPERSPARALAGHPLHHPYRLSAAGGVYRRHAVRLALSGQRQPHHRERQGRRLRHHRAELYLGEILPAAPLRADWHGCQGEHHPGAV